MLAYFSGRYHIKGLYISTSLSCAFTSSQVRFVNLLRQLERKASAVHHRHPLAHSAGLPGAQIFSFDAARVEEVAYEDTTHYRIYKQFFIDRNAILQA